LENGLEEEKKEEKNVKLNLLTLKILD